MDYLKVKGSILVVSGPSGSGKTSLARAVCEELGDKAYFSISTTTRPIRDGEKDGVDYFFVTKDEFLEDVEKGYFLEWAEVHGNFYGTSKIQINKALDEGKIVFLDIDVQGHEAVRKAYPDVVTSVFVTTKDKHTLIERLKNRGTETEETLKVRMINALHEMKKIPEYDYLLINDDFEVAKEFLRSVAISSLIKTSKYELDKFINHWKGSE
ncbi:guanylate kinase [Caminibacter pacificus]|jgi:guanylate kinase|uniref:Guanylate kinase n=1 Tax=Caminibacter pacificus TaxID=1424653 RepID=A0AAJ4UXF0_9BACT|nr:guanylate kinase [Caminibacter pacificus]QCI28822.1 guanylate kinase [Caminibacter pacificus]ROR39410.1 guanylate kinase [Caminibacter pacificus]